MKNKARSCWLTPVRPGLLRSLLGGFCSTGKLCQRAFASKSRKDEAGLMNRMMLRHRME